MADDTNPESVALLLSMMGGNCDEATVKRALTNCGGQVETAAEWLISHMASGGAGEPAAAPGGGQTAAGAEGEVAAPAAASAPGAEEPKAMSLVCLE